MWRYSRQKCVYVESFATKNALFYVFFLEKMCVGDSASNQGVAKIRIGEYIRIFSDTNIRSYHIRIIFLIRIYSDIRSYCFFDTNIFGYSFVSFF